MATLSSRKNVTHQTYDIYTRSNDYVHNTDEDEDDIMVVLKSINSLIQLIETLLADKQNDEDFFVVLNYMLRDVATRVENNNASSFDAVGDDESEAKSKYRSLYSCLTSRERDVLESIVNGKMNKVIAYEMDLSVKTVEACRSKIKKKMHAKSIAELVKIVIKEEAF